MGEERDDLMRRGALLEDGALLMPAVRTKQGFLQGASACAGPGVASTIVPSSEIREV